MGKTSLALEVARALPPGYEDGAWLVELAPLADPSLVPTAVAGALGVREEPGRPTAEALVSYLEAKRLLLVLDNCEHLVEACAGLAARLLAACPGLRILATSRAPLHLRGERALPLEPFPVPDLTVALPPAAMARNPAVALFAQRARAVDPAFALTAANAPVVAEICARLDGLPLAIELAAARVKLLPPPVLLARLGQRLPLLIGRERDRPERHRTVRAAVAWSYELLEPEERTLFRRLAIFHGGGSLEAIVSICVPDATEEEVLLWLETLVEQSLVRREPGDEPRYGMLETLREYALEQLAAAGEEVGVRARHRAYFLALAEAAEPALWGAEQATWLERLERDLDNLRVAVRWASEAGELELGLRLATALCQFWRGRGRPDEGYAILTDLLARQRSVQDQGDVAAAPVAPAVRASALSAAGALANLAGQFAQAASLLEESAALFRGLGDRSGLAGALTSLGTARHWQGEHAQAAVLVEEGLALYRELGDRQHLPEALRNLGMVRLSQGDLEQAALLMEQSVRLYQELGNMSGYAYALNQLEGVVRARGNLVRAVALESESLAVARQLGDTLGIAQQLQNLGYLAYLQGDLEHARTLYAEGLALPWDKQHNLWGVAFYLEGVASVAAALGHAAQAARLLGAAEALREAIHAPQPAYERDLFEQVVALVRATLDPRTLAARWAEGRALPVEQAVAAALEMVQSDSQPEQPTRQAC